MRAEFLTSIGKLNYPKDCVWICISFLRNEFCFIATWANSVHGLRFNCPVFFKVSQIFYSFFDSFSGDNDQNSK